MRYLSHAKVELFSPVVGNEKVSSQQGIAAKVLAAIRELRRRTAYRSPENLDRKLNLALKVCLSACFEESTKCRASWRVVVVLLEDRMVGNVEGVETSLKGQPIVELEVLGQIGVDVPIVRLTNSCVVDIRRSRILRIRDEVVDATAPRVLDWR